jgi:hypothetical protein
MLNVTKSTDPVNRGIRVPSLRFEDESQLLAFVRDQLEGSGVRVVRVDRSYSSGNSFDVHRDVYTDIPPGIEGDAEVAFPADYEPDGGPLRSDARCRGGGYIEFVIHYIAALDRVNNIHLYHVEVL